MLKTILKRNMLNVKKEKMKYPGNVLCVLYSGDGDRLPVYIADSEHTGIARARGEATESCLFQELNFPSASPSPKPCAKAFLSCIQRLTASFIRICDMAHGLSHAIHF